MFSFDKALAGSCQATGKTRIRALSKTHLFWCLRFHTLTILVVSSFHFFQTDVTRCAKSFLGHDRLCLVQSWHFFPKKSEGRKVCECIGIWRQQTTFALSLPYIILIYSSSYMTSYMRLFSELNWSPIFPNAFLAVLAVPLGCRWKTPVDENSLLPSWYVDAKFLPLCQGFRCGNNM